MDSIHIETGEIRLSVNKDESRVIKFNPSDLLFAEKFYKALGEIEQKAREYQKQAEELDADKEKDGDGLPLNMGARLALLRSICDYNRSAIDSVFGEGTSQAAFGDAVNLDMFSDFFAGIEPYFKKARTEKISKHIPNVRKPAGKRSGRK